MLFTQAVLEKLERAHHQLKPRRLHGIRMVSLTVCKWKIDEASRKQLKQESPALGIRRIVAKFRADRLHCLLEAAGTI